MTRHGMTVSLFVFFLIILSFCLWGQERAHRPEPFAPFHYKYSAEELKDKFSGDMMNRAKAAMEEVEAVNSQGPWKPSWTSLDQHKSPEWLRDAKFGVIINWSLAAVPSWDKKSRKAMYPDAYGSFIYDLPSYAAYHAKTWGINFQYDDFFPLFTAQNYDPEGMAELLKESGVRYIIPLCKHHDGVAWWDSAWTQRNFVQMGPHRDLLTPLVAAARKRDMKVGLYFTWEEYANVTLGDDGNTQARVWPVLDHKPAKLFPLTDTNRRRVAGNIPVRNYFDQYIFPLGKELVDRFDPDGLYMDGEWCAPAETLHSRDLAAYLYNKSDGRKEVFTNDRYGIGSRNHHGDIYMNEFYSSRSLDHPWEALRGISNSFAYNHEDTDESMMTRQHLVDFFVDTISHNGNLNLVVGPDQTGRISDLQVDRLKALGAWIKVNSEAVYGSRALAPYAEGKICYTQSKDGRTAYAICKRWPGKHLLIKGVHPQPGAVINMLGVTTPLSWKESKGGVVITISDELQNEKSRPCEYAWVIRVPIQR